MGNIKFKEGDKEFFVGHVMFKMPLDTGLGGQVGNYIYKSGVYGRGWG